MQVIKTETATIVKFPAILVGCDADSIETKKPELQFMSSTCGAAALWLSQAALDAAVVAAVNATAEEKDSLKSMKEGYFVFLYEDIMGQLSVSHQDAILEHELSHIRLGHIQPKQPTGGSGITVINQLQYELVADNLAAKRHGKDIMRDALIKTVHAFAKTMARIAFIKGKLPQENVSIAEDEIFSHKLKNRRTAARIRALS